MRHRYAGPTKVFVAGFIKETMPLFLYYVQYSQLFGLKAIPYGFDVPGKGMVVTTVFVAGFMTET